MRRCEGIILKILMCVMTVLLLLRISYIPAIAADGAEAFDIQKGEVVKTIPHSANLQREVEKWLSAIDGPIGSLSIEPDSGIAVKVELAPPLKINNPWIKGTVTQVVLFVSESDSYTPKLLIFTQDNHVLGMALKYDLHSFLKKNDLYRPQLNLSMPN
jgi:hypothetical protein